MSGFNDLFTIEDSKENNMLVDITMILDRSGSMEEVATDTIGGFNKFLKDQKEVPGRANFTMVLFDDLYEVLYESLNIQDVPELTSKTFVPRGWTALLDAIGRSINMTKERFSKASQKPDKVLFVILTDGKENRSREFTKDKIFNMIKTQTDEGYDFVFLGANQDAIEVGGSLGTSKGHTMTYSSNVIGTANAFNSVSNATRGYRINSASAEFFTDDDRKKQEEAAKA